MFSPEKGEAVYSAGEERGGRGIKEVSGCRDRLGGVICKEISIIV